MILVLDIGTTGLRAALVADDGSIRSMEYRACPPSTPAPGLVELDAAHLGHVLLEAASAVIGSTTEPITAVGVSSQRATTIVWDRATGEPIGPGLGWQDLRTVGECIVARATHGIAVAPNQTVTKAQWLLTNTPGAADRDLCIGTVDSWAAWVLSGGQLHVTDHTNAGVTGLYDLASGTWSARIAELFGVPLGALPTIVDSCGVLGEATALPGAPPIAALVGDQQASLVGQACVRPGDAKITFGTGGMLDVCSGTAVPAAADRTAHGTFPIVAWSLDGVRTFGSEGIMLSAGTNVEWLRDDLGLIESSAQSHDVAARCDTSDGVVYVPALLGLGTPHWDYGARGSLFGVTRGTERRHVVRAVLEGVAHRGVDLVDAAEADVDVEITALRIDGGMSENPTFVQALADLSGRPVEVSPVADATTVGAGYLAGIATGTWSGVDDIAGSWRPSHVVEPTPGFDRPAARAVWHRASERARAWIPELSALDF
ncbi:MAG: FGGY family carbohydrate kinase [Ilumatobacteraceae bacterium]|nr:FGGY family carbohydrate kinase [Ilumatobacteraceae bacterium]